MKNSKKLQNTILLVMLCFTLIPLLIFGSWIMYDTSHKIEDIMQKDISIIGENHIRSIDNFCEGQKIAMEMMSKLSIVQDSVQLSLAGEYEGNEYLDNYLLMCRDSNACVDSISVIDRDYHVVSSSEDVEIGEISMLKNSREAYKTGEFYISRVMQRGGEDGILRDVIAFLGIYDGEELIGYIVEEISTDYFDSMRNDAMLGDHAMIFLIDDAQQEITVGGTGNAGEEISLSAEGGREFQRVWKAVDLEENPTGSFVCEIEGSRWLVYYSGVDYTDWSVRVCEDIGYYTKQTSQMQLLVIIALAGCILVILLCGSLLSRYLVEPISNIVGTLKKVKDEKDYSARVKVSNDKMELYFVAEQINGMLEIIEKEALKEKEIQQNLSKLADKDALTEINNKRSIESIMEKETQKAQKQGSRIAIGFMDIDDFKQFNTKYGHHVGDQVLRFVASLLTKEINGSVGRVGGDEFTFCITSDKAISELETTLEHFISTMNNGITLRERNGEKVSIGCSIGVVVASGDEDAYVGLLGKADKAMYSAKNQGKNCYSITRL